MPKKNKWNYSHQFCWPTRNYSQNPGNGTKSWYQSKEKRKERKERGEGGEASWLMWTAWPFSCPHQEGRERRQIPSPLPLHPRRMKEYWFVWQKVSFSIFFFWLYPLIHPNTCSGKQNDMTQSATSLANWWAMSKENISKNIMMLAGKIGFHLHRNSQEYLFGEMFL